LLVGSSIATPEDLMKPAVSAVDLLQSHLFILINEKTMESLLAMSVFDYHTILKASPEMKWNFKMNCRAFSI
jgi:hypothetical protein